jgi:DNA polymerase III gamma/tau subunit
MESLVTPMISPEVNKIAITSEIESFVRTNMDGIQQMAQPREMIDVTQVNRSGAREPMLTPNAQNDQLDKMRVIGDTSQFKVGVNIPSFEDNKYLQPLFSGKINSKYDISKTGELEKIVADRKAMKAQMEKQMKEQMMRNAQNAYSINQANQANQQNTNKINEINELTRQNRQLIHEMEKIKLIQNSHNDKLSSQTQFEMQLQSQLNQAIVKTQELELALRKNNLENLEKIKEASTQKQAEEKNKVSPEILSKVKELEAKEEATRKSHEIATTMEMRQASNVQTSQLNYIVDKLKRVEELEEMIINQNNNLAKSAAKPVAKKAPAKKPAAKKKVAAKKPAVKKVTKKVAPKKVTKKVAPKKVAKKGTPTKKAVPRKVLTQEQTAIKKIVKCLGGKGNVLSIETPVSGLYKFGIKDQSRTNFNKNNIGVSLPIFNLTTKDDSVSFNIGPTNNDILLKELKAIYPPKKFK